MSYYALVPAAGSGARMGRDIPKQYLMLDGRPLIWHALATLCAVAVIERVFVVLAPDDEFWLDAQMSGLGKKLDVLRCGGATRAESVSNGLRSMLQERPGVGQSWVLVHDAARPCLTVTHVETLIGAVADDEVGGILAMPVADTLKRGYVREQATRIETTVAREGLWQAQTPQMFRHHQLLHALAIAPSVTDEASAIESLGLHPKLVEADSSNFKVTYPQDLALAAMILEQRRSA